MRNSWIYILGVLFFLVPVHSQQRTYEIKLKLAQSYERSRDFDNAIKLYEEIYQQDSSDNGIFEALKRNYLQVKKYPEAIAIINRKLAQTPRDLSLISELGSVYVRNAEEAKGFETWNRAILLDSTSEVTYAVVANAMMDTRLLERAIETYKRGRVACNKPNLFIPDLAYLYSNTLQYGEATEEYIKLIHENPGQLGIVQSRMAGYVKRDDGLTAAIGIVERASISEPENLTLYQLLAWLYMERKQYGNALDVYKRIDEKTKSGGREIFNFAERAFRDKAYSVALQAYQVVIQTFPKFQFIQQSKFGYARTLEEMSATGDTLKLFGFFDPFKQREKPATESEPQFTGAVSAYQRVVSEYPKTEVAARSLVRIARLMYERFFNLDEARTTLTSFLEQYVPFTPLIAEGTALLGDVYLANGDLDKAEKTFQSLKELRPVAQELRDLVALRSAEILYFRNQWKSALEQVNGAMNDVLSNMTNDALTLQIFIQANYEKNSAALGEFAKADFLKRQRKLSEALAIYEEIFKQNPQSELADEALMSIGDTQAQMRRFSDAVGTFERLVSDYSESINLDKAMMKIGQIYELGMNDKPKAISAYERLLAKFPTSVYVSEARNKIRELRGDNI